MGAGGSQQNKLHVWTHFPHDNQQTSSCTGQRLLPTTHTHALLSTTVASVNLFRESLSGRRRHRRRRHRRQRLHRMGGWEAGKGGWGGEARSFHRALLPHQRLIEADNASLPGHIYALAHATTPLIIELCARHRGYIIELSHSVAGRASV